MGGQERYEPDNNELVERWKNSFIETVDAALEEGLPQNKIYKTGTDVSILYGRYGFDKTSSMLVNAEEDYFITFWQQRELGQGKSKQRVLILCTCVALKVAEM